MSAALDPMLFLPVPAWSPTLLFDLLPVGGTQELEKAHLTTVSSRLIYPLASLKEQPQT